MIRTIIIEDESKSRSSLRKKLEEFCPDINIVGEAEDGNEGLMLINKMKPQLVFLDIEMPKLNGFEMLNAIEEKNFYVIFTTAYNQYAIKAIKYAAFDYLLKPIDVAELQEAVSRISTKNNSVTNNQVDMLMQNMMHPKKQLNKLAIPTLEGLLFFDINEIIHLEANRNYTNIFFSNKPKIIASKTLKDFEELLPTNIFFRIHHSHLINLNYIKKYIRGEGGQIELQNGSFVDVSRRKKDEFLKIIGY